MQLWYVYGKDENGELHAIINGFNGLPLAADNEHTARQLGEAIVGESDGFYIGYAVSQIR